MDTAPCLSSSTVSKFLSAFSSDSDLSSIVMSGHLYSSKRYMRHTSAYFLSNTSSRKHTSGSEGGKVLFLLFTLQMSAIKSRAFPTEFFYTIDIIKHPHHTTWDTQSKPYLVKIDRLWIHFRLFWPLYIDIDTRCCWNRGTSLGLWFDLHQLDHAAILTLDRHRCNDFAFLCWLWCKCLGYFLLCC